jgi:hypothetical protein
MEEKYSKEFWQETANAFIDLYCDIFGGRALIMRTLEMGYSKEEIKEIFYDDEELIEECYKELQEEEEEINK